MAAVRDPVAFRRRWPDVEVVAADFNRDFSSDVWQSRLDGVEGVINCAGVLHGGRGQDIEAIHATAPIALFDACVAVGIRRVVQVSAISADEEAGTEYARTKKRADDHLRSLSVGWTILRPSLVYGEGSYGGTSALRGLAGLPCIAPQVGDGSAAFRPIHVDDLAEAVARVMETDRFARQTLEPVGPEIVCLRDLIAKYRAWLGLPPVPAVSIPMPVMRVFARLADLTGGGPLGTASLRQLEFGNTGKEPAATFAEKIGFTPRPLDDMLARRPAQTQDLWHARLYFLRPLLRAVLILLWLGSALAGLLAPVTSYAAVDVAFSSVGLPSRPLAVAFSGLDLLIAAALLMHWRPRWMAAIQFTVVGGYTILLTFLAPALWLEPFGALLKNLPILALIGIWAILEMER